MDVKEFFYSGGIVACKDRTESDVLIEICRMEGFNIYNDHNPEGFFHAAFYREELGHITFYNVNSAAAKKGIPFGQWMAEYVDTSSKVTVEDLL